jgi:hypothetical protein
MRARGTEKQHGCQEREQRQTTLWAEFTVPLDLFRTHFKIRECLNLNRCKIADMIRITRMGAFVQLAPIPDMNKQAHRRPQGVDRPRKTARRPRQPRAIVAQLSAAAFHRVGLWLRLDSRRNRL